MAIFDTVTKSQVQAHPMDFVNYCLGLQQHDVTFVELITPEQPTIEMHQADILIKVKLNGQDTLVHLEFQTTDSYNPDMSLRMAGYVIRILETYQMPVSSNVIYLRPDAGKKDTGYYQQDITGNRVFVEYQVIRLTEMDGQQVLETNPVGLLPFTPLMKRPDNLDAEQWLRRCIQVADNIEIEDKPAYLVSMAVLGILVYDHLTILDIIMGETMHESTLVEYLTEKATAEAHQQGIQHGEKKQAIKNIFTVLELRFKPDTIEIFIPVLLVYDDLQRLNQLLEAAILAESPDYFRNALELNKN
ncbi:Rpn family recombination-promoting nuclease/putative transposase [Candidatus Poribacteria bacterium]|nr:Rpn family recombination-promoting nuclease/putative transposase [Candidatus Poribacteria bacterium]